jgi:hypothetical protein
LALDYRHRRGSDGGPDSPGRQPVGGALGSPSVRDADAIAVAVGVARGVPVQSLLEVAAPAFVDGFRVMQVAVELFGYVAGVDAKFVDGLVRQTTLSGSRCQIDLATSPPLTLARYRTLLNRGSGLAMN